MPSTWTCAKHLTICCITSLSLNWRYTDFQMKQLLDKKLARWSYSKRYSHWSLKWRPVAIAVPQGPVLGPSLFKISVSDMDSGVEGTLGKFVIDTKLCGAVNTLEGRDAVQRDLNRLEKWACVNLMKFNTDKHKVLHLGWGNPKYKLGGEWIMK
ncbi:hypothetical protein TURU_109764 [Turdus rufiventris]|nr:hypothetical protein TURU_109764 [Turdus rufiventris]